MEDYKNYSLEQLKNWVSDSLTSSGASPQEIYDTIRSAVKEEYYIYKHQVSRAYDLLVLLNDKCQAYENVLPEGQYSEYELKYQRELNKEVFYCDKNDPSSECQKSWDDFWEQHHYPEENSQYTEEELNAMCDKAASDDEKEKCREYNLREAEYYDKRAQLDIKTSNKVVKWQLPVQVDGITGDCFCRVSR